ncbi:MAG: alpha-glucuronidase family glycosyl hydrolase [Blastocatellia bacterium]|nr:alpha-glucuronidase family glycosyl hydrolase [Blastocatellia bacterium]
MNMNKTISKCLLGMSLGCLALTGLAHANQAPVSAAKVALRLDRRIPQIAFAAQEIQRALADQSVNVIARNFEDAAQDQTVIVLAAGAQAQAAVAQWQVAPLNSNDAQSYAIRVRAVEKQRIYIVLGADAVGAMYGGLELAEAIRTGQFKALKNSDHAPHIAQRGIKFNIPLDLRTPTYNGISDSAQHNIAEMWSMEFWREFLDDMARHRYNVLSLWSLNPFPSIVKTPEFPNVALEDVWRTRAHFDDYKFNGAGNGAARPEVLATREVVKRMTMDEKIEFWRAVMQLAHERGVDIYWFTWNIFLDGVAGHDGVTNDKGAPRTIAYFRAAVRETIRTYPLLAGFGITAGESMEDIGTTKEKWLWQTYGEGIRDALKEEPHRKFRLIHRFHQTGLSEIQTEFAALPCPLDVSFKYAVAHMYSIPRPPNITPVLPLLGPRLRSWLTVRNDDIYSFRWADYEYARAFIKAIPPADKIAGFYMGPDGYVWGRDFLTKDAGGARPTVMQKQWHSFALWGRLAFEPDLPAETFQRLVAARFPKADAAKLIAAWADASKTFPYITRFFWGDIDVKWLPEACLSNPSFKGYYTVRHFVEGGTMPGAGVLNILEWRASHLAKQQPSGVTPLEIAATLKTNATNALKALPALRRAAIKPAASATEYRATLNDIEAMAHLGNYYAAKIRGACALALFDKTGEAKEQAAAVQSLETALNHWKRYSAAYTRQYAQPVRYNRVGLVDIPALIEKAAADVQIAREWKVGAIDDSKVKRSGTEAGFKQ